MTLDEIIKVLRRYDKDFLISIIIGYIFGEYLHEDPYSDIDIPNDIWDELIHIHLVFMAHQGEEYGK